VTPPWWRPTGFRLRASGALRPWNAR